MFDARYTFGARVAAPLADVRDAAEAALRAEGFGVLTEIDVAATLRAKLGVERDAFVILGACNPSLAHRALSADPSVGALLPCNVVLRSEGDSVVIEAMDPAAVLNLVDEPEVRLVAAEAGDRLRRAVGHVTDAFPAAHGAGAIPGSRS